MYSRETATGLARQNIDLVEEFYAALNANDWDATAALFTEDGLDRDDPKPKWDAVGPAAVARKLIVIKSGVESATFGANTVGEQDHCVMTERTEAWHLKTGEAGSWPIVCMHKFSEGKISLWIDYWDIATTMKKIPNAP